MEEGQKKITTKIILELMGAPKEHVEETMKSVIQKVKDNQATEVINEQLFDAKEVEGKPFWSTFCEFEIKFDNLDVLIGFCFDFMPSSVEITDPKKLGIDDETMSNLINDLLARLHQYDMMVKNLHAENIILKRKLGVDTPQKPVEKKE